MVAPARRGVPFRGWRRGTGMGPVDPTGQIFSDVAVVTGVLSGESHVTREMAQTNPAWFIFDGFWITDGRAEAAGR
jgi:hypothetical protein